MDNLEFHKYFQIWLKDKSSLKISSGRSEMIRILNLLI